MFRIHRFLNYFILQTFNKFLQYKKNNNDIIHFILQDLTKKNICFQKGKRKGDIRFIEIHEKDLLELVSL